MIKAVQAWSQGKGQQPVLLRNLTQSGGVDNFGNRVPQGDDQHTKKYL